MLFRIVFSWLFAITLIQESITQETVEVNNFAIHLCDSYQTSKLAALIGDIEDSIENVINDLALGTSSKHGYTTFFKQDANRAEISTVYRKIQMGANILVQNGIASLRRPTFICSNNQPGTNGLYEMCQENPTAPVMRFRNSNLIPICPVFWTARQKPNRKYCPVVVNNTLTPNNDILLLNQLSVLVWSLVYLYHAAAKDTGIIDGGIATASNLNAAESLLSPQNYAFYYACG